MIGHPGVRTWESEIPELLALRSCIGSIVGTVSSQEVLGSGPSHSINAGNRLGIVSFLVLWEFAHRFWELHGPRYSEVCFKRKKLGNKRDPDFAETQKD